MKSKVTNRKIEDLIKSILKQYSIKDFYEINHNCKEIINFRNKFDIKNIGVNYYGHLWIRCSEVEYKVTINNNKFKILKYLP